MNLAFLIIPAPMQGKEEDLTNTIDKSWGPGKVIILNIILATNAKVNWHTQRAPPTLHAHQGRTHTTKKLFQNKGIF